MRTPEDILEQYRKGNFFTRLNLYLEYRDLRPEFTQIDPDERALPQAALSGKKASRIPGVPWFARHRIAR